MAELDELKTEIREQIDGLIDSLQLDKDEIKTQVATILADMEEALVRHQAGEPGQMELVEQLAKEIRATVAIPVLERNREAKERVLSVIATGIRGFFSIAFRVLGAGVLILGLLVLPGCAWLAPSTSVPRPVELGVAGLVENLCQVATQCVAESRIPAMPSSCDDTPGMLYHEAHGKEVDGMLVRSGGADICAAIDQCVAAEPPLPSNMPPIYSRWCGTVQGIADAAIGT